MTKWDELQPKLRKAFLRRGAEPARDFAAKIPVSKATLYRLVGEGGSDRKPPHAVQESVQRLVEDKETD
jgi:hypothetical protein